MSPEQQRERRYYRPEDRRHFTVAGTSKLICALTELHRAVTEHDGSDADDARLADAVKVAQGLSPYTPEPVDANGF